MIRYFISFLFILTLEAQPPPVPASYQDLYTLLDDQIQGFDALVNAGWKGQPYPVAFSAQLVGASSECNVRSLTESPMEA